MTFEDFEILVVEYGSACEKYCEYHSIEHIEQMEKARKNLLNEIKKLLTNK